MSLQRKYDYIISGGGLAGLSLAYRLINSSLSDKKILLIEPTEKNTNDRTWAFWEAKKGTFEEIVYKKWTKVLFGNQEGLMSNLDMGDYAYKVIRGIDFYNFTIPKIKQHPNVTWLKDCVSTISETEQKASVSTTQNGTFEAALVFDSTYKPKLDLEQYHNLLQHFMGWVIETPTPRFNPELPVMMNFGVEQQQDCRFVYVMPFSDSKALIEYTLFSSALLTEAEYKAALVDYIENILKIKEYTIDEVEFGVIPMSNEPMKQLAGKRIIRIGTAGGATNPATGYTFQGTQKNLKALVENLEKNKGVQLKQSWLEQRFGLYQSVLLHILNNKKQPAAEVFSRLYAKNPAWKIFRFLDNETNFSEEISIMWSTKKSKFGVAAMKELWQMVKQ